MIFGLFQGRKKAVLVIFESLDSQQFGVFVEQC